MKFWPFGTAVGFLASVLISACSSDLLGNMSRVEGKWMTPRPGRPREPSGTKGEKRRETCLSVEDGCCTKCSAGKFLKNCACETCGSETYLEFENSMAACFGCVQCTGSAQQVVVIDCAPEHNRKCGCRPGYYKENEHGVDSEHFLCHRCDDCGGQNKQTKKNCSEKSNTVCGDCLPGFYRQGDECQTEGGLRVDPENIEEEQPGDLRNTAYLLLCLPCLLLLGAIVTYRKRRRISGTSSPVDPSRPRSLLQGTKLYAVIDTVPVRRWKEFMRGLGLRDGEIEAVEVEHTQLREQQYEMLKRWRQQQGATADAIFAVLEDMQLGGCAQELREKLQPSTLLPTL